MQALVNNAGAVLDQRVYDAFGNITSETNPSQGDRFGSQGMQWEAVPALYVTWGRQFDPKTGRWTTVDPSGLRPDSNRFRYVGNGPTNGTDPTGLMDNPQQAIAAAYQQNLRMMNASQAQIDAVPAWSQTLQTTGQGAETNWHNDWFAQGSNYEIGIGNWIANGGLTDWAAIDHWVNNFGEQNIQPEFDKRAQRDPNQFERGIPVYGSYWLATRRFAQDNTGEGLYYTASFSAQAALLLLGNED